MKYFKCLIFFASVFALFICDAGAITYIGNGTSVVVCRANDKITSIDLLDVVEMRYGQKTWKMDELFDSSKNPEVTLNLFLQKFSNVDSKRSNTYFKYLDSFFDEVYYVNGEDEFLEDTQDNSSVVQLPKNCTKEILISQTERLAYNKKYAVNRKLFKHPTFSHGQRALAMLHEFIYRELISEGRMGNARPVRMYTTFLASETFGKALKTLVTNQTRARYLKFTQTAGFYRGYWNDHKIELNRYENNRLKEYPLKFCPNAHLYRAFVESPGKEPLLTQWDCESGEIEKIYSKEQKVLKCPYTHCSLDGDFILHQAKKFGLYKLHHPQKQRILSCDKSYPVLNSYVCEEYELSPLNAVTKIEAVVRGGEVFCDAELNEGRWSAVNFFIRCDKQV